MQINHQVHLFLSVDDTRVIMNWIQGGTSANVHFGEGQISYTLQLHHSRWWVTVDVEFMGYDKLLHFTGYIMQLDLKT